VVKVTSTEVAVAEDAEVVEVDPTEAVVGEVSTDELATDKVAADELATDEVSTDEAATDEVATDELVTDELAADVLATANVATEEVATFVELEIADPEVTLEEPLAVEVALAAEVAAAVEALVAEAVEDVVLLLAAPVREEQIPVPASRDFGKYTFGNPLLSVTARFPLESVVAWVQPMTSITAWLALKPVSLDERVREELPLEPLLVKTLMI